MTASETYSIMTAATVLVVWHWRRFRPPRGICQPSGLLAHIHDNTGDVVPAAPFWRFFNQSLEGVVVAWAAQHLPNRLQVSSLCSPSVLMRYQSPATISATRVSSLKSL